MYILSTIMYIIEHKLQSPYQCRNSSFAHFSAASFPNFTQSLRALGCILEPLRGSLERRGTRVRIVG